MEVENNVICSPVPSPQPLPSQVLKNVIVVFDESIDTSLQNFLKEKLINCNASISNNWKPFGVGYSTHLITKNTTSTLAKHVYNLGGFIVSPEWVVECEKRQERILENEEIKSTPIPTVVNETNDKTTLPMDVTTTPDLLPSVFRSLVIYIWNDVDKAKEIRRHIIAYDGDVVDSISKNTTHVIANNWNEEFTNARATMPNLFIVKSRWVYDSVKKKSLQKERPYFVHVE